MLECKHPIFLLPRLIIYFSYFNFSIPISMRANTNAVSMMVGEKCSEMIKEDYGLGSTVLSSESSVSSESSESSED